MANQFTASLWRDEAFSAILSQKQSLIEVVNTIINDTSPPLWNIFEWIAFKIFGTGEIVIRGLSFIFFLGTVFFVFKIASFLWDKKTGLIASVLLFLNPFFFIYAFEGRMYSILAMGITASFYYFFKKEIKGHIIFTLWALYSHNISLFAILIQGFIAFFGLFSDEKEKYKKLIFTSFPLIFFGYLPWSYPLYLQSKKVAASFWINKPTFQDLINLLADYIGEGIKSHPYKILSIPLHKIALFISLAILLFRKWVFDKRTKILLSWFLGPILLVWLLSLFSRPIFFNRYLLFVIPALTLLLSSQRRAVSNILIILLIFILLPIDIYYFGHPTKEPFREMFEKVKEVKEKEPEIFLINWYHNGIYHLWESKYYKIEAPVYSVSKDLPFFTGTALLEENDVTTEIPKEKKVVGVITSAPVEVVKLEGYRKSDEYNFANLRFLIFRKDE